MTVVAVMWPPVSPKTPLFNIRQVTFSRAPRMDDLLEDLRSPCRRRCTVKTNAPGFARFTPSQATGRGRAGAAAPRRRVVREAV